MRDDYRGHATVRGILSPSNWLDLAQNDNYRGFNIELPDCFNNLNHKLVCFWRLCKKFEKNQICLCMYVSNGFWDLFLTLNLKWFAHK